MKDLFDQSLIHLNEETHVYTVKEAPNLTFESVTTWIKSFFNPFEKEKIARKCAQSSSGKYASYNTVEEVLAQWTAIADRGTQVHLTLEDFCEYWNKGKIDQFPEPEDPKAYNGYCWLKANLEPHFKLYPEMKVYSTDLQLSGTIDLLIHETQKDSWIMADWKTNSTISKSSWGNKKGVHYATRFLDDCNYLHYSLQMSVYQWILEKEYGFENAIEDRILLHLRPKQTRKFPQGVKEFHTPYLNYNVQKMVKARRERKANKELFKPKLF